MDVFMDKMKQLLQKMYVGLSLPICLSLSLSLSIFEHLLCYTSTGVVILWQETLALLGHDTGKTLPFAVKAYRNFYVRHSN